MKVIFSVISISLLFAACQSGSGTATTTSDTTGLAELQALKLQQEKDSLLALQPVRQVVYVSQPADRRSVSNTSATTASSESSNTASRSRVSKTAKGAIIGGVAGAAGGAIINKRNRAAGAVIGGVVGAGTGAVIGRQMDKRDGRN